MELKHIAVLNRLLLSERNIYLRYMLKKAILSNYKMLICNNNLKKSYYINKLYSIKNIIKFKPRLIYDKDILYKKHILNKNNIFVRLYNIVRYINYKLLKISVYYLRWIKFVIVYLIKTTIIKRYYLIKSKLAFKPKRINNKLYVNLNVLSRKYYKKKSYKNILLKSRKIIYNKKKNNIVSIFAVGLKISFKIIFLISIIVIFLLYKRRDNLIIYILLNLNNQETIDYIMKKLSKYMTDNNINNVSDKLINYCADSFLFNNKEFIDQVNQEALNKILEFLKSDLLLDKTNELLKDLSQNENVKNIVNSFVEQLLNENNLLLKEQLESLLIMILELDSVNIAIKDSILKETIYFLNSKESAFSVSKSAEKLLD